MVFVRGTIEFCVYDQLITGTIATQLTGFNEKYERRDTLHYFPLSCDFVLVARSHYSSARAAIIVIIISRANPVDR